MYNIPHYQQIPSICPFPQKDENGEKQRLLAFNTDAILALLHLENCLLFGKLPESNSIIIKCVQISVYDSRYGNYISVSIRILENTHLGSDLRLLSLHLSLSLIYIVK